MKIVRLSMLGQEVEVTTKKRNTVGRRVFVGKFGSVSEGDGETGPVLWLTDDNEGREVHHVIHARDVAQVVVIPA